VKNHQTERLLILVVLALLLTGIVMVYSASAVMAGQAYGEATWFVKKQILWAGVGLLVMAVFSRIPYRYWKGISFPLMVAAVIGLVAVLTPALGQEINGSRRWLRIAGLSFQPSEVARLATVVYLASYLARRREHLDDFARGFLPPVLTVGFLMSLILTEPDFGTAAVMGLIAGAMMFLGGIRLRHLWGVTLLGLPAVYAMVMRVDYRRERMLSFLNPWEDPTDKGFQIIQSFLALGEGGTVGTGLGEGWQKLFYLPYPHTDFIFAVIGEELGLIGTISVLGLFALVTGCGVRIARAAPDAFGRYLAFGVTLMIVLQAQINMAVVTGLLPTKGLTLPLLSYGGSSLLVNLAGVGILLSVAREGGSARAKVREEKTSRRRAPVRQRFRFGRRSA
jgi:cell division protein FtsW